MSARLSSLVINDMLSKDSACKTKSAHAVTGSFELSKIVPVAGVNVLPHSAHR